MSTRRWIAAASVAVIGLVALRGVPAGAHHSSAPFYDATITPEAVDGLNKFALANGLLTQPLPYEAIVATALQGHWKTE